MIKFVREYKDRYGYINYDVIHETNGKRRWYLYMADDLPKTARRFIKDSKDTSPYKNELFQEYGTLYK